MHFIARRYVQITLIASLLWQPWFAQAGEQDSCAAETTKSEPAKIDFETIPDTCNAGNWEKVADYVGQQVTLLRMAVNRADYTLLAEYGSKVETAVNRCPAELISRVCNVECSVQRASVILFEVSDLVSLSEKPGTVVPPNPTVKADNGVRIIDDALSYLLRGNRGSYDELTTEHSPSFNQFLRDQGRLQAIKARLLIAQGDAYYKNLSRTRATTIRNRIRNVLSETPVNPKVGEETDFAMGYYETASWAIQEALIDLPQISSDPISNDTGSPGRKITVDFGSLRQELEALKIDVEQRQSSINSGFLFLNIDPETFTTLSTDVLQNMLQNQLQELQTLEGNIRSLVQTWVEKKESQQTREQVDAKNLRDERTLEVTGLQIASYEQYADRVRNTFDELIRANGSEVAAGEHGIELLERQQFMSNLSFELKKLQQEAEGQIKAINSQRAQDLTILSRERHQEKRDNLKWLIDASLTTMNLELQLNEYKTQVADFVAQMSIKDTEIEGISATIQSKKALQAAEENKQKDFLQLIEKIKSQMSEVYEAHQMPLDFQICALAQEYMNYVGEAPRVDGVSGCALYATPFPEKEHWEQVIKLRREYFGENGDGGKIQKSFEELRTCMEGNICVGAADSMKELIQRTYEKQTAIVMDTMAPNAGKAIEKINDMILKVSNLKSSSHDARQEMRVINIAAGLLYVAAAGKEIGALPSLDLGEQLKAAYEIEMYRRQSGLEMDMADAEFEIRKEEFELQKQELMNKLSEAAAELDLHKIARDRAMVELVGKTEELKHQNLMMHADASIAIVDAQAAKEMAKAQGPKIIAQIKEVLAQKKALKADNGLLAHELNSLALSIETSKAEWQSMAFDIKSLEANKKGVERDRNRINALKINAEAQWNLVDTTKKKVDKLNKDVDAETSIVAELYAQQEAGISALSKEQIDLIKSGLSIEDSRIQTNMIYVKKIMESEAKNFDLVNQGEQLKAGLLAEMAKINEQLRIKRCEMINFAFKREDPIKAQTRLFLASEDVIATLTQGIPEYIRAKKNRLDYVNYIYNLYRSKVNLLSQMSGPLVDTNYNYIQNSSDLLNAMKDVCTLSAGASQGPWICKLNSNLFDQNKMQIPVASAQFTIPGESGFMSRLIRKGSVRFEITPDAVSDPSAQAMDAELAANGYFQLWQAGFNDRTNMSLVNIALNMTMPSTNNSECTNKVFLLVRHLGYGTRYFPVSSGDGKDTYPVLAVTPVRQEPVKVWDGTPAGGSGYLPAYAGLTGTYDSESFPEGLPSGSANTMQAFKFLGAPLVGTYEISFDRRSDAFAAKCMAGRPLNIGLAYTTPFTKPND